MCGVTEPKGAEGEPTSANFIVRENGVGVGMAAVIAEAAPDRMQLRRLWVRVPTGSQTP